MRTRLLSFLMLVGWLPCSFAGEVPEYVVRQHRAALTAYLIKHPHFYIAPDSLCDCDEQLQQFRKQEPEFRPYYAVGDINDDGIQDFAVGLLDARTAKEVHQTLTVVVFQGPFRPSKLSKGIVVIRDYPIKQSQEILSVFKTRWEQRYRFPTRLDLGPSPFGSDNNWMIRYDWKARKYVVY